MPPVLWGWLPDLTQEVNGINIKNETVSQLDKAHTLLKQCNTGPIKVKPITKQEEAYFHPLQYTTSWTETLSIATEKSILHTDWLTLHKLTS
jgi:hypothetical protein